MPEETLIAGIGTFKATDGDDRTLLLDLTSDGVCGSLGSLCCLGMSYFGLIRLVCTTGPRWFLFFSRNVFAEYSCFCFFFFLFPSYTNPQFKNGEQMLAFNIIGKAENTL